MKKIKLLPTEYYQFVQVAKFAFTTFGVTRGFVIVEANIELLRQIGY
jgi:hypothetical protein